MTTKTQKEVFGQLPWQWWRPCAPSSSAPEPGSASTLGSCIAAGIRVESRHTASFRSARHTVGSGRGGWCSSWRRSQRWRRRCCERFCASGRSPTARRRCRPACLPGSVPARWPTRQLLACIVARYIRIKGNIGHGVQRLIDAGLLARSSLQLLSTVSASSSRVAQYVRRGKGFLYHGRSAAGPGRGDRSGSGSLMHGMQYEAKVLCQSEQRSCQKCILARSGSLMHGMQYEAKCCEQRSCQKCTPGEISLCRQTAVWHPDVGRDVRETCPPQKLSGWLVRCSGRPASWRRAWWAVLGAVPGRARGDPGDHAAGRVREGTAAPVSPDSPLPQQLPLPGAALEMQGGPCISITMLPTAPAGSRAPEPYILNL